ncbi:hypothetical protein J6590_066128 [Homalodisca vitripennis]|nr:hypothetical protein J6590_066128 [Homalodisca vitripennis]
MSCNMIITDCLHPAEVRLESLPLECTAPEVRLESLPLECTAPEVMMSLHSTGALIKLSSMLFLLHTLFG